MTISVTAGQRSTHTCAHLPEVRQAPVVDSAQQALHISLHESRAVGTVRLGFGLHRRRARLRARLEVAQYVVQVVRRARDARRGVEQVAVKPARLVAVCGMWIRV